MDNTTAPAKPYKTISYFAERGWDVRTCEVNGLILVRQTGDGEPIEMMTTTPSGCIIGEHSFPDNDYGHALLDAASTAAMDFIR